MTSNFNGVFSFFLKRFPRIFLNQFLVSVQHFILSIPDYHHINFQRFPHFSITINIFNREFWGVTSRNTRSIPLYFFGIQIIFLWCPIFGIHIKAIVCFLSVLLLLLILRVFFSFPVISILAKHRVRYSISILKYFSEQILVALARNHLRICC